MTNGARKTRVESADSRELLLMRLRYAEGRVIDTAGNQPILLDDPEAVWIVYSGRVEVFSVRLHEEKPVGARYHLMSAEPGTALFGMSLRGWRFGLLVISTPGTQLMRVGVEGVMRLAQDSEFTPPITTMIDQWINLLSSAAVQSLPPRDYTVIETTPENLVSLPMGSVARTRKEVIWTHHREGSSRFSGREDVPLIDTNTIFPLANQTWIEIVTDSVLETTTTDSLLADQSLPRHIAQFHMLMLNCLSSNSKRAESSERRRLEARTKSDQAKVDQSVAELASILNTESSAAFKGIDKDNPLLGACQIVGNVLGVTINAPVGAMTGRTQRDPLRNIAQASRMRLRQVVLRDEWWKQDSGPLLAYLGEEKQPVALIQNANLAYEIHDPVEQKRIPVTQKSAIDLQPYAYTFYRPFADKPVNALSLLKFGMRGTRRDLITIVLMGIGTGILGTLIPLATGIIFDQIIPSGGRAQLIQLAFVLLACSFATVTFQISQGLAFLRLEGKMESVTQSAVFDRLINLPATFFRDYSSGDLGIRAMGVSHIRETLSRVGVSAIISAALGIFSFIMLFFYSVTLALAAAVLVAIFVGVVVAAGYAQIRSQRALLDLQGKLSGTILQYINGIAKFRIAGAERRAFSVWATQFASQRKLTFRVRSISNNLSVFNSAFPIFTTMVIFGLIASGDNQLSVGGFLAFSAAFAQFLSSALSLGMSFVSTLTVVPTYERAKPILETLPEVDDAKADPGELDGSIELSNVSFRYANDGPNILDNVSLLIRPGDFVALVGPSGSGKSTILRLLLGFEKPVSGSVLYSGQDLSELDVRAVRRQIGVVLQNGKLMTGDIFSNIIGSNTLTIEDAWEAAFMAGFDEDIKQMPMGMQTVISEGGGTLSGGQRQRLLIARALVTKPRIVFFDEATSALDNRTQEIVSRSLESLDATRVVIAHRLTTIQNADWIYVVERGKIVQSGNYNDLINQVGLFADLAKRQLA